MTDKFIVKRFQNSYIEKSIIYLPRQAVVRTGRLAKLGSFLCICNKYGNNANSSTLVIFNIIIQYGNLIPTISRKFIPFLHKIKMWLGMTNYTDILEMK